MVNFVGSTNSLRLVKSDVDVDLSSWYRKHSRVYVASSHACWSDADLARKVSKKRFGNVTRSDEQGLASMMTRHAEDVRAWLRACSRLERGDTTEVSMFNTTGCGDMVLSCSWESVTDTWCDRRTM